MMNNQDTLRELTADEIGAVSGGLSVTVGGLNGLLKSVEKLLNHLLGGLNLGGLLGGI